MDFLVKSPYLYQMDKKVIGYICGSDSWGGLEMNQFKNAIWMTERGHDVCVFGLANSPLHIACKEESLSFKSIKMHKKYYDLRKAAALKRQLVKRNVSHLFVRDPKDMSLAALTKTLMQGDLVLVYFMEMQLGIDKSDWIHTLRFKQFDYWCCPLPYLKEQVTLFTNYPASQTVVIPSALDVASFHHLPSQDEARDELGLPKDLKLLGIIGRFDQQKGQLLLLQALKALRSKHPDLGVVLLGERTKDEANEYYQEMLDYVSYNKLEDVVFIRPFRKDVRVFYAAIDAFVMASKSETFGMVTIEAMVCGVPIIGSRAGGTTELLKYGEFGRLFDTMNLKSLLRVLEDFLEHPSTNSQKLLAEAQHYDYSMVCEQIEDLLGLEKITT